MKTKIEKLDHNGRGISFINEKIAFINNALPGEEVEIKIINEKKKLIEADAIIIKQKSSCRIEPKCKFYENCGGCDIMHMSYSNQLAFKKTKLEEILKKFANIDTKVEIIPSEDDYYYRDKITLKVFKNKVGYYKRKTNNIIEIDECIIADNKINQIIKKIKKINDFKSCYEVSIRNVNSEKTAVTFYLQNKNEKLEYKDDSAIINYLYKNTINNIKEESKIIAKLNDFEFIVSPEAFFQINVKQTTKLYDKIKDLLKNGETNYLLDLYCGTGTIGIYLANLFKEVYGIEICQAAVEDANKNKELNNIKNIQFRCGDTEKIIKQIKRKFDTVIVDPPRAGLTKNVINDLFRINPRKIVYVSCDPVTLARDINLLQEKYTIDDIIGIDMFPNTYHVETIVSFSNKIKE